MGQMTLKISRGEFDRLKEQVLSYALTGDDEFEMELDSIEILLDGTPIDFKGGDTLILKVV